MTLIVALTGAFGLLCSFCLLRAGVESMAMRYPLALACAYLFFMLLLWLWLRTKAGDYDGFLDLGDSSGGSGSHDSRFVGGDGEFGGGGATGSFDSSTLGSSAESDSLSATGDAIGSSFDLDELAIPIVAIALAAGLALASLYVVYIAPVLFAELVFDGLLSYSLYRRLRRSDASHWITGALRHTAAPFALTALFLWAMGAAMGSFAPGSHSIGEVVHYFNSRH